MTGETKNRGWSMVAAGVGINLALGILYTWSVLRAGMVADGWGWSAFKMSLPYSTACLIFSLVMVPAGRMQDKIGPRITATIGGLLVGAGMIMASLMGNSVFGYVVGFGVLTGAGIGFGYASATPPAVKWFNAKKTGMIAGIVVSGFGLASAYAAPLSGWMIENYGLTKTVMYLGIGFMVIVAGLAQLLAPPPKGYVPEGTVPSAGASKTSSGTDYKPGQMMGTWQFWTLWFMYAAGAGAGLMIISIAMTLGKGIDAGIAMVMALAIGNGGGRIIAGMLSDKLGRKVTLIVFMLLQAGAIIILSVASKEASPLATKTILLALIALVGANYGSNLALFPSFTKDFYGLKNFGMNYGLVFTAWGVGGFMLATMAGKIKDATGVFTYSYYIAAGLLVLAAILTLAIRAPKAINEQVA